MWTFEHQVVSELEPTQIWKVLSDLDHWTDWDTSMEYVRLNGAFVEGGTVTMKPIGQDAITSAITNIVENQKYADQCTFNGLTLRFSHTLTPTASGGTTVVHRLEIDGQGVDEIGPIVGPQITEDFPAAMNALLQQAGR